MSADRPDIAACDEHLHCYGPPEHESIIERGVREMNAQWEALCSDAATWRERALEAERKLADLREWAKVYDTVSMQDCEHDACDALEMVRRIIKGETP